MVRVALAQINSIVGDFNHNCSKIIASIKKARRLRADFIIFPELAVTGYPPEDLLLKPYFISENIQFLRLISKECKEIIAFIGCADRQNGQIYNSCAVIQNKQIRHIYHKIRLPNYGVFDEKRYFRSGEQIPIFTVSGYNIAVTICEDVWTEEYIQVLKPKKIDFLINISASPFHLGKVRMRERVLSYAAKELGCFVVYCNLVGGQDGLVFDGTSKIINPAGKVIKCARRFEEDFWVVNLSKKKKYPSQKIRITEKEEIFSALRLGLYDYVRKNCFKKVIIGVSGGIDSAVVVALAVLALGKRNTCALIMPSRYTSKGTFSDAKKICDNLGIEYRIVSIEGIFSSYIKNLKDYFKGRKTGKTEENIQARIRGNILMAFSNKFGYLVLNTGNKSEVSCGYCTLYGDMVGGFGILKDVPKLLVYKLAHYINRISKKKIIPSSVIKREPSAELRANQKDADSLPSYGILDPIVKLYVEDDYSLKKIVKAGFDKKIVKKVIRMIDGSEYKRRQAPVGIKVTPRAFGKDRRMPITNRFFQ